MTSAEETTPVAVADIPCSLPVPTVASDLNTSVADFLKRDVLLRSALWDGTALAQTHIDPWNIILSNTAVRNKLANYTAMRADLVIRADINGTPSHYGRLLIAYEPYLPNSGAKPLGTVRDTAHLVQLPHFQLDPTTSEPVLMTLPYINNIDWMDLTSTTGPQLGVLWLSELNALEMMSDATPTAVRYRIFGHLENVELMGATEVVLPTYIAQASEYSTGGWLSRPLSAVANAAGTLVHFPIIGIYARATEIAAGAASKLAALFGFSKPSYLIEPSKMRTTVFESFAPLVGYDYSTKLSADPKKELSINVGSVGICGQTEDELSYGFLARKWGYIGSYTWSPSTSPLTALFALAVQPALSPDAVAVGFGVNPTPLALCAAANTYWNGDIEFKIEIVASAFHKGRLRMIYDPQVAPAIPTNTNVLFSDVVDISYERSICYTIPYQQPNEWCNTNPSAGWLSASWMNSAHTDTFTNGVIKLFPDNELSSTLSTQGAYINVYIRGGENIQFAHPNNNVLSFLTPQSKVSDTPSTGGRSLCVTLGNRTVRNESFLTRTMGENNQSLRSLMKRSTRWRRIPIVSDPLEVHRVMRLPNIPLNFGDFTNAGNNDLDSGSGNANYVRNTPVSFLRTCFLGYRGNQRWKILFDNPDDIAYTDVYFQLDARVDQLWDPYPHYNTFDTTFVNPGTLQSTSQIAASILEYTGGLRYDNGFARLYPAMGEAVEFEVPDYNTVKFHTGTMNFTSTSRRDNQCAGVVAFKTKSIDDTPGTSRYATIMHSAGEDFNFFFFKFIPTVSASLGAVANTTLRVASS